jgi:hypothetical protein
MYGEYVEYEGYMVWVSCLPQTSQMEKDRQAKLKVRVIIEEENKLINKENQNTNGNFKY